MNIGVPKEIKTNENRVALVPAGAERSWPPATRCSSRPAPALGSGFTDEQYTAVGAKIAPERRRHVGATPT